MTSLNDDDEIDETSDLYDNDLRKEIVYEMRVDSHINETDISAQLRQQRIRTAATALATVVILALGAFGIFAYLDYVEKNTFTIRASDIAIEADKRYTFAVSQKGQYLVDAFLMVNAPTTRGAHTYFKIDQIAPEANDTYYWSIREDGFYQFLDIEDDHPQFFIPFPLRPGMKWKTHTYPDDRYSYNKQTVEIEFAAAKETILDLPYGPVVAIEVIAREKGGKEALTLWVSKESPITKLNVDPEDPTFVAELSDVLLLSNQLTADSEN